MYFSALSGFHLDMVRDYFPDFIKKALFKVIFDREAGVYVQKWVILGYFWDLFQIFLKFEKWLKSQTEVY